MARLLFYKGLRNGEGKKEKKGNYFYSFLFRFLSFQPIQSESFIFFSHFRGEHKRNEGILPLVHTLKNIATGIYSSKTINYCPPPVF